MPSKFMAFLFYQTRSPDDRVNNSALLRSYLLKPHFQNYHLIEFYRTIDGIVSDL